jgi:imidazole glycerol phosphate synthase glutamine amidotransferase subunit
MSVVIVDTGVSNTASVRAAIRRATGLEPTLTTEARTIERAERVVLPGVGSFAAGMAALERCAVVDALRVRATLGRPTLAICLGMQLLCAESDESPGVPGLGVIEARVERFNGADLRVPHFGWNKVEPAIHMRGLEPGHAYFAHSYRVERVPEGWTAAICVHGGRFVAALQRGDMLACQFHPELSGRWGARLIERWAASQVRQEAAPC